MSVIGIDIGGTKTYAVVLEGSEIVDSARVEIPEGAGTTEAIATAIEGVALGSEKAIGIGVAGLVAPREGLLVWGPHLSGTNVAIADELADRYNVPVFVDNDANTALYAELGRGVAVGYRDVLLVTLGTGIGGAIAINGEIYRGSGFAGEWGHSQVEREGLLCDCGKRGCWETLASGPALARLAHEVVATNPEGSLSRTLAARRITGIAVVEAADGGDETARALVAQVGRSFGQGLADLTAILDPELIVVGGGLGSVGESILGPARRVLADSLHGGIHRVPPTVQVARLGPAAGAIGAAMLAAGGDYGFRSR